MGRIGIVGALALALAAGAAGVAQAQAPEWERIVRNPAAQKKAAAPKRQVARAPTRIIVRPSLRNRGDATEFPRADNLGYPGPNAVRQCVAWLATEHRPSGTVVVPRRRCWWARG